MNKPYILIALSALTAFSLNAMQEVEIDQATQFQNTLQTIRKEVLEGTHGAAGIEQRKRILAAIKDTSKNEEDVIARLEVAVTFFKSGFYNEVLDSVRSRDENMDANKAEDPELIAQTILLGEIIDIASQAEEILAF